MITVLPLISVIVPVYNREKYISVCMDSLLRQSYRNVEIVIVDDGSKDNSRKICESYADKDSRIRLHLKSHGEVSDARNYGIDKANGDYVCFVDSDDYVDSDYVEYLYGLVRKYNVPMSICQHRVHYNSGTVKDLSINTLTAKYMKT